MKLSTTLSAAALVIAAAFASQANAQIVYAAYTGSQTGITVRDSVLNQSTFIPTNFNPTSIAAGASNSFYVTAGDKIIRYGADGAVLKSFSFGDPTIVYSAVALGGPKLYAVYNGSQRGVSIRNATTLVQENFFPVPFNPSSVAVGPNSTLYITGGSNLYHYNTSGLLLATVPSPDPGVTYTGIAVKGNRVYASYLGSQNGFTVRDLSLNQLAFHNVPFSPFSIDTGINNDVYLSTVDHLFRYTTTGVQLKNMTFPTITYRGVASEQ